MKTALFSLFALLVFSVPALAQDGSAREWSIVSSESHLNFEGTQMGAVFKGHFQNFSGKINFDTANLPGSRADITIDMGSVDATSGDRNKYLAMPDWFNIGQFPEAHFVTTSIEKGLDINQFVAKGNLTIRDKTLPVVLPFTLTFTKDDSGQDVAHMAGETAINRLDYGVGQGQWSDTKTVENQVKLRIQLVAKPPVTHSPL